MAEPKPRFSLSEMAKRINDRLTGSAPEGIHIPYGARTIELPPEVGDIIGVAAQTENIAVIDCTHGVVTITFPLSVDWSTEPQVRVDLLLPVAGMGF